jgi:hypothetical protein
VQFISSLSAADPALVKLCDEAFYDEPIAGLLDIIGGEAPLFAAPPFCCRITPDCDPTEVTENDLDLDDLTLEEYTNRFAVASAFCAYIEAVLFGAIGFELCA